MENKFVINTDINAKPVVRGIKEIEKDIMATEKAAEKLNYRIAKFKSVVGPISQENAKAYDSRGFRNMQYDAEILRDRLEELQKEKGLAEVAAKAQEAADRTEQLNQLMAQLGVTEINTVRPMEEMAEKSNASAGALAKVKSVTERIIDSFRGMRNENEKTGKSIRKENDRTSVSFNKMLKTILKYGFGIRSFYFLMRKIRTAITEGFKSLAQFNDGVNYINESISNIMNAATRLRNSMAAALAPLLSIVEPAITRIINLLTEAIDKVGIFFSALAGKSTYIKAKKVNNDFAKSLNNVGSSAAKAKRQLAGFYELNTISGDNGSGGGSGGGSGEVSANDLFEEIDITGNKIAEFANSFRERLGEIANSEQWERIKEKFGGLRDKAKEVATVGFKFIIGATPDLLEGIENVALDVFDTFDGIVQFLDGLAKGDWQEAWGGLQKIVVGCLNGIDHGVSGINDAIRTGLIQAGMDVDTAFKLFPEEWFEIREGSIAAKIRDALYGHGSSTRVSSSGTSHGGARGTFGDKASFDGYYLTASNKSTLGNIIGANTSNIANLLDKLPHFASGAVVPRTAAPFAAIMGDNNSETEVVSPLSTMKQAVREVMAETRGNTTVNVVLEGDAKGVFKLVKTEEQKNYDTTGNMAFVH
jgi:hypothetical protein